MEELSYYNTILIELEQGRSGTDDEFEIPRMNKRRAEILNAVIVRLGTDHQGLMADLHTYKTECCSLLLRSLQLKTLVQTERPGLLCLKRKITITALVDVLQELYHMYKSLENDQ